MENHGALVGWGHFDTGDRILLRIESIQSQDQMDSKEPDMFRVLMTKQQAVVLGSYLIEASGQRYVPAVRRSWFRRLFG